MHKELAARVTYKFLADLRLKKMGVTDFENEKFNQAICFQQGVGITDVQKIKENETEGNEKFGKTEKYEIWKSKKNQKIVEAALQIFRCPSINTETVNGNQKKVFGDFHAIKRMNDNPSFPEIYLAIQAQRYVLGNAHVRYPCA